MISIDRMMCVVYPYKYKYISNKKTIFGIICGLMLLHLLLNSPKLLFKIEVLNIWNPFINRTQIIRLCTSSKPILMIRDTIDVLTRSVIPFIIQGISSIVMLYSLFKRHSNIPALSELDRKFAFVVLVLNIFFFVTQTPEMIATIYLWQAGVTLSPIITEKEAMIANFVYALTVLIAGLNPILVFFINLAFNQIFRDIFTKLIRNLFGHWQKPSL